MNAFDMILLVLVAALVVLGLLKGLVRSLAGIGALIVAFVVASRYHQPLAQRLGWLDWPVEVTRLIGYLALFFAVILAGGLLAFLIRKLVKASMLGWADRLGGGALGLAMAAMVAALVLLPLVAYSPSGSRLLRGSVLAPYVTVVADVANSMAPQELSRRYRERVGELRLYWRERWDTGSPSTPSHV